LLIEKLSKCRDFASEAESSAPDRVTDPEPLTTPEDEAAESP
jgi:hypothetical protein